MGGRNLTLIFMLKKIQLIDEIIASNEKNAWIVFLYSDKYSEKSTYVIRGAMGINKNLHFNVYEII